MSYFLQFLIICALTVLGCSKVTIQGSAGRRYLRNVTDRVLFNAQSFCVIALVMLLLFPQGSIAPQGWLLVVGTAVATVLFQLCYVTALKEGPVSLTVLIVNFSILFITGFGVAVYGESIYLTQLIGIGFLVLSMVLSVKKEDGEKGVTLRWLGIAFLAMAMTSVGTILMKVYVKDWLALYPNSDNTFTALVYVTAAVIGFLLSLLLTRTGKRQAPTNRFWHKGLLLHVLGIGTVLGIYQRFYIVGMAQLDSAFMFPTYAGMQSTGMTLIGVFFFRDRLSTRQLLGIAAGIVCVVLMNLRVVELF